MLRSVALVGIQNPATLYYSFPDDAVENSRKKN